MPMYNYNCSTCATDKDVIKDYDKREEKEVCEKCNTEMTRVFTAAGGYRMRGNNGASVTPRGAGSFRGKR